MHIEPGFVAAAKVAAANATAAGILLYQARHLIRRPDYLLKTLIAALFFSLFMESFHLPVGPSELHFVGASAIYLTLGFVPTLLGFGVGLLFQGLLFEPADLYHLGVNSLSLILPLIASHALLGRKLAEQGRRLTRTEILKLDAIYYGGVTAMVGFWLAIGETATPLAAWAAFASSYLILVAIEPFVTYAAVRLLKRHQDSRWVSACFAVGRLQLAR